MKPIQRISACLWFDNQAEDAARFYTFVFKNSKITAITRYTDVGPRPKGSVLTVVFELDGQEFTALNGGPEFKFSGAISFMVNCETQKEIDEYWGKLLEGGKEVECGWLTDKFGLSWQVVPTVLGEMIQDKDSAKADRVMRAMMTMKKMDIASLERAYQSAA